MENSIVRINFNNTGSKIYVIERIIGNKLFLRDLISHENIVLINDNGNLTIEGVNDQGYNIEFINTIPLTNIPEVDTNILVRLDDDILQSLCQTDAYINSL